ncbi:MAG: 1-acyl-sn-glycerol-3-phosphate acyltransferase [Mycoplasmataceae bacterium]|jgi:1-acyl-sn-glycerol-3-phosphate acyltransferase|nr:1-acyl-sn-glycerol-3-phosphate acyltransferase [Mycoplasmataceae bacterium]
MKTLIKVLKAIGYGLAYPFVGIGLIISFSSAKRAAKKYRKAPNKVFLENRYYVVYKLINRVLFLKRIKVQHDRLSKVPTTPCLFVYNHKSNLDALILIKLLYEYKAEYFNGFKMKFVAKQELNKKKGVVTAVMDLIDTLYIDRDNIRQQLQVFDQQNESIKNKYSIVIAPEGTRVPGDEFGEFKAGAFKVAYTNMTPIQPIVIYGSSGLLFDKDKTNTNKSRQVYVNFMPYLKPFNFHTHNIEYLSNEVKNDMQNTYDQIKARVRENRKVFEEN